MALRHAHETGRAQEGHLAAAPQARLEADTQSLKSPSPGTEGLLARSPSAIADEPMHVVSAAASNAVRVERFMSLAS